MPTAENLDAFFAAVAKTTPKEYKPVPKRMGAKRVKLMEKLQSAGEVLNSDEATMYRALAARANDLTLDRPDTGVLHKEAASRLPGSNSCIGVPLEEVGALPGPSPPTCVPASVST